LLKFDVSFGVTVECSKATNIARNADGCDSSKVGTSIKLGRVIATVLISEAKFFCGNSFLQNHLFLP
jgi:hypothetical protein